MKEVVDFIKNRIRYFEVEDKRIEDKYNENYDPSEWSGGNFDDCYNEGVSDGETFGALKAYKTILEKLNKGDVLS